MPSVPPRYFDLWPHFGDALFMLLSILPVVVAIGALVLLLRRRGLPNRQAWRSTLLDGAIALTALGIGLITLLPQGDRTGLEIGVQWAPFESSLQVLTAPVPAAVPIRIVLFNVLLFVPLGLFVTLRTRRFWAGLLSGVLLSVVIETTQALAPLGRVPNIDDVLLNSFGTLVGGTVAVVIIWSGRSGSSSG